MDFDLFGDHDRHHAVTIRLDPQQLEKILTALSDLTAAVTALEAEAAEVVTALGDTTDAALPALTARIKTVTSDLAAALPAPPVDTFTFTPASLPAPVAGTAYSQALTASSTDGAATLTVPTTNPDGTPNALPDGATFDGSTLAWSTPVSGTYSFDILATDSTGATATLETSWTF